MFQASHHLLPAGSLRARLSFSWSLPMRVRSIPAKKLLCTTLLSALAMPAALQAQNNNAELDRVTVTGSRIKRTEVEAALPITTLKKDEIER